MNDDQTLNCTAASVRHETRTFHRQLVSHRNSQIHMRRLHLRNHHLVAGPDLALGAGDGEVLLPAYEDALGMFAQFCLLSAHMCLATIFS